MINLGYNDRIASKLYSLSLALDKPNPDFKRIVDCISDYSNDSKLTCLKPRFDLILTACSLVEQGFMRYSELKSMLSSVSTFLSNCTSMEEDGKVIIVKKFR